MKLMPGASLPHLPAPVAIGFRVRSLAAARRFLAATGSRLAELPGQLLAVDARDACGVTLLFCDFKEKE